MPSISDLIEEALAYDPHTKVASTASKSYPLSNLPALMVRGLQKGAQPFSDLVRGRGEFKREGTLERLRKLPPPSSELSKEEYEEALGLALGAAPLGMASVGKEAAKGTEGLTSAIMEHLGRAKSPAVSRQFVEDALRMPGVKRQEAEEIKRLLAREPDVVDVARLKAGLSESYLPLKASPRLISPENVGFIDYNLDSFNKGMPAKYGEIVYESPVATTAGAVHGFDEFPGYFAHVRYNDLVRRTPGKYGPDSLENTGTRQILELQSDLFQKKGLQKEFARMFRRGATEEQAAGIDKLMGFEQLWPKRAVREEIARAARDMQDTLQFPTGKTISEIESLRLPRLIKISARPGGGPEVTRYVSDVTDLAPGEIITVAGTSKGRRWMVIDVGEAKDTIDAIPFEEVTAKGSRYLFDESKKEVLDAFRIPYDHPVYKFYENQVPKLLRSIKPEMKRVLDKWGNEWWEIPIKPEDAVRPVFNLGQAIEERRSRVA